MINDGKLDINLIKNKRIIVFGTSGLATKYWSEIIRNLNVMLCTNNDMSSWGTRFNGITITNPNEILNNWNRENMILICSSYYDEISNQLKSYGLRENIDYAYLLDIMRNIDTRKSVIVYGNCQTECIKDYLRSSKSFIKEFYILDIPLVFQCDPDGLDENLTEKCDLFIYQEVGNQFGEKLSTEYILNQLPTYCRRISIPNAYFTGYYPQYCKSQINRIEPDYPFGKLPYGDKNIIQMMKSFIKEDLIEMISDLDFISYEQLLVNVKDSLEELKNREKNLDVKVMEFIQDNYRSKFLFYAVNHPSYIVTRYIAMKILGLLKLPEREIQDVIIDYLNDSIVPIYPSVISKLDLSFIDYDYKYNFHYSMRKTKLSFREYISEYIDYYME